MMHGLGTNISSHIMHLGYYYINIGVVALLKGGHSHKQHEASYAKASTVAHRVPQTHITQVVSPDPYTYVK